MPSFPLIKLGALAIRQISKPLANSIKTRAKSSPFFRNYICMPPAQMYHYFEVNVKMKLLGLGKPTNVTKLNEAAAIELGAELLGEGIIFFVAVLTLTAEYYRQSKKASAEADAVEKRWSDVERSIRELEYTVERYNAEIRELNRLIYANQSNIKTIRNLWKPSTTSENNLKTDTIVETKSDLLQNSIQETVDKITNKK